MLSATACARVVWERVVGSEAPSRPIKRGWGGGGRTCQRKAAWVILQPGGITGRVPLGSRSLPSAASRRHGGRPSPHDKRNHSPVGDETMDHLRGTSGRGLPCDTPATTLRPTSWLVRACVLAMSLGGAMAWGAANLWAQAPAKPAPAATAAAVPKPPHREKAGRRVPRAGVGLRPWQREDVPGHLRRRRAGGGQRRRDAQPGRVRHRIAGGRRVDDFRSAMPPSRRGRSISCSTGQTGPRLPHGHRKLEQQRGQVGGVVPPVDRAGQAHAADGHAKAGRFRTW